MNLKSTFAAALAVSLTAVAGASTLTVGDPAPPIKVAKWVQGDPVKNGPGGYRVVEFWATWCGPCKESIPHLTQLAKKFKGKVSFTGVDVFEQTPGDINLTQQFVKSMGTKMSYNVAADDAKSTMAHSWMEAAKQPGIPTAFVLDKTGAVVWIGHPMMGLEETLDQLVAGKFSLKKAKADYAAEMAKQTKEEAQQAAAQAQQAEIEKQVEQAMSDYKAGKKTDAIAEIDKVAAAHADLKTQFTFLKFQMVVPDDKKAASAIVDTEATTAGKKAPYAYLQFGMIAVSNPKATKDDFSYGTGLADKAIALTPTDPIVGFESANICATSGDVPKAISLDQDALKNVPNAPAQIQERLKSAIQAKLSEYQTKKK